MGCPLATDKGLSEFKKYPILVKQWIKNGQIYLDTHRDRGISANVKFSSAHEMFMHNVFFDSYQEFSLARDGMFGRMNCKERLEEYFGIEL